MMRVVFFFFSSRRRHTRSLCDWSSDVCSSDLAPDGLRQLDGGRPARVAAARAVAGIERVARRRDEVAHLATVQALHRSEERREGKSGDLGGGSVQKKKKGNTEVQTDKKEEAAG